MLCIDISVLSFVF